MLILLVSQKTRKNKKDWKEIIDSFNFIDGEVVIMTKDFNAHNQVWNCANTERNGKLLLENMEDKSMVLINRDILSRIGEEGIRPSNIDQIFTTNNIYKLIAYKQYEDLQGSDHYPVVFELNMKKAIYKKRTNRISKKRTEKDMQKLSSIVLSQSKRNIRLFRIL